MQRAVEDRFGRSRFDELALMQDIDAMAAAIEAFGEVPGGNYWHFFYYGG